MPTPKHSSRLVRRYFFLIVYIIKNKPFPLEFRMQYLTLLKISNSLKRTVTQMNNNKLKNSLNRAETTPLAVKASNIKRFPIHRPINSPSYASRSIQNNRITL